ncbi:MAG: ribosomal L7Ae/L30e/S12e/Gadd45 family protein [Nanoarchaeota archaeon]|nr:ribosomal L7Ae/L30e/S12e/Gadd45 family protein [Nanoarchaeota archaeon]
MDSVAQIKKAMEEKKLVIGTKETIKMVKYGKVSQVFLSENCPEEAKEDIHHLCGVGKVLVTDLSLPNTELGITCKKPFSISVVSIRKEAEKQ